MSSKEVIVKKIKSSFQQKRNIFIGVITCIVILGVFCFLMINKDGSSSFDNGFINETVSVDDLDIEIVNEMYYVDNTIKEWVDEVKFEKGIHKIEAGDFQYLMLSGGEYKQTGHVIAFLGVEVEGDVATAIYSIVSPEEGDEIKKEKHYPYMILRLSHENVKFQAEYIEESEMGEYLSNKNS